MGVFERVKSDDKPDVERFITLKCYSWLLTYNYPLHKYRIVFELLGECLYVIWHASFMKVTLKKKENKINFVHSFLLKRSR